MVLALGISHKTAPVGVREKLAFSLPGIEPALQNLANTADLREVALLSTCNRTEFYCEGGAPEAIAAWWKNYCALHQDDLMPYLYSCQGENAAQHVMRVACGLDSMILGEPQIFGQLKDAYQIAHKIGLVGTQLGRLFQTSFSVAKQVRSDLDIATNPVSIAYASVCLAKQIFTDLASLSVLLVGAGDTIELVSKHLIRQGVTQLTVANRSLGNAEKLASRFSGKAVSLEGLSESLLHADIVISSTGSPEPLLDAAMLRPILIQRKHRPIFMVDLAVPRDIHPEVDKFDDIYLYTIDDLQNVVDENLASRKVAAEKAEKIIHTQANAYMGWRESEMARETIKAFREHIGTIKDKELKMALKKLKNGQDPEAVLTHLAHSLSNKFMHTPSARLRQAGHDKEDEIIDLINQLYM